MTLSSEASEGILLASGARSDTNYSNPMNNNKGYRGLFLVFNCTTYPAGGATPSLQWFNPATSAWVTWLTGTGAKIVAVATYTWAIYPSDYSTDFGATVESETPFPSGQWRVAMTHDDALSNLIYSVGYVYLN